MDKIPATRTTLRLRSIFISDVHLGFKGCRAEFLLDFLRRVECQQLYLVGDIIDVWSLTRSFYWPQAHNDVIRTILGKAKHGTRVVYVPGNHDRPFRDHDGLVLGNVEIRREILHETADGRRFLVLHGDEFDAIVQASPLLESLGSTAYSAALRLNRYVNAVRRLFGYPYFSVAAFLKHKVKNAVKYIANFERALAVEARRRGVDGVICGHIHRAEISEIDGITYCNDGDWVESCTALVEDFQGRLSLLKVDRGRRGPRRFAGIAAARRRRGAGHGRMKLALVTDAWLPQVNGVVRTLGHTVRELSSAGHDVTVISPADFRTIPCPTYPEIRLALFAGRAVRQRLAALAPDAVHIATEGPLGLAARNWCIRHGWPFTTAYHTQFPEYLRARFPIPLPLGYAAVRWFHGGASRTLVTTRTMQHRLEARGFRNLALWGRGVDTELFYPRDKAFLDLPRPVFLYFGRLAVEKGVEDFLRLDLPGTKLVVGDGPAAATLSARYPGGGLRRASAR